MLAVVGVAAAALGTGFLNNDIELWIQQFGVGSGDISTPVDHITVDFGINQVPGVNEGTFENVIDVCYLTLDEPIGDPANTVKSSELTCKLTGKMEDPMNPGVWIPSGQVIAEGTVCAPAFPGNQQIPVAMGVHECGIALGPTQVDVKAVGDVIVVAHANTYSVGDTDLPPPGPP